MLGGKSSSPKDTEWSLLLAFFFKDEYSLDVLVSVSLQRKTSWSKTAGGVLFEIT